MTLLSIVLALAVSAHASPKVQDILPTLLETYWDRLSARFSDLVTTILFIAPVCLVIAIMQWWFLEGAILLALLLAIFLLANCLEYGELVSISRNLSIAKAANDTRQIDAIRDSLGQSDSNPEELQTALLARSFSWLFFPLFWFAILGPVGAVFSVQCQIVKGARKHNAISNDGDSFTVYDWIVWLPARSLVLSFALLSNFDDVMKKFRAVTQHRLVTSEEIVFETANVAIETSDFGDGDDEPALAMIKRVLMFWLVLLAALTIVGWLV